MSMSALGSQLAALSSSSTSQKGLAVSSTRDTTQSIGRGFAHSSKAGHALRTNDVRSRASILYGSAREAADVTTVTLRENAIAALEGLAAEIPTAASLLLSEEFVGNEGLLSEHRLKYERGTSTSAANAEVDKSVCRLLDLMGTVAVQTPPPPGDDANLSDNPTLIAALSVIEYLIRQYQIHANHLTAGRLLYTLLPLQVVRPTAYPGVFGRVLSLVDLQELGLTFLRPFAARQAPPVTRCVYWFSTVLLLSAGFRAQTCRQLHFCAKSTFHNHSEIPTGPSSPDRLQRTPGSPPRLFGSDCELPKSTPTR